MPDKTCTTCKHKGSRNYDGTLGRPCDQCWDYDEYVSEDEREDD